MTVAQINRAIPYLCGIPIVNRLGRTLVMFKAFVDDYGTDPKSFAFAFSAWVASESEWQKFSNAWFIELKRKPSIDYFKHHEAKSQSGQFAGWKPSTCDRKILALAKVIVAHDVYAVTTGISNELISFIIKKSILPAKTLRSVLHTSRAYDFSFHSIIGAILQQQVNLCRTGKVDFIFDEGDAAFDDCAKAYRQMRDGDVFPPAMKAIAGIVTTADDKRVMPLQAADLLAGQSTMELRGQKVGKPYHILRKKNLFYAPIGMHPTVVEFAKAIYLLNVLWPLKTKKQ